MHRHFTRVAGIVAAGLTLIATALAGPASTAQARPAALAQPFSGRLYGVAAASPRDAWAVGLNGTRSLIVHWNGESWTQALSSPGFLRGVAAASPPNAWAVGGTDWFTPQTLIEHWGGNAWTRVPSPSPAPGGYLNGVAATSARNAWAVGLIGGGPGTGTGPIDKTLIEHWNGNAWTRVPSPSPAPGGYLNGVAATSARNAWAVGLIGGGPGTGTGPIDKTLIEHWNGNAWTRVPSPTPRPAGGLSGVAAISATDAWAVGWTGTGPDFGGTSQTLIEHWNGNAWTRVPSPGNVPGVRTVLNAVAAASPHNVWAVGSTHLGGANKAFIVHWDGTAWNRVLAPTPVPGVSLLGVTATSPRDAWAVGQTAYKNACGPKCATVIEHWNGSSWALVPSPNPSSVLVNVLLGVAATSPRNAWAVGTNDYESTLIAHWNGMAWK
jgi:hypothetical protein